LEELGRAGRDSNGGDVLSLYLLRHGETAFSHHNRFCGRIDAPLTAEGRAMASAFADAYANVTWKAIVTSTRTRTVDTATPTALRRCVEIRRDSRLDEMSYGDWQGLSKGEAAGRHPEHFARWLEDPSIGPPNGELPCDVAARAMAALDDVRARHRSGNVLIVSHKAILRIVFCQLMGMDVRHYRGVDWPVAGVTRIDIEGRHLSLQMFADVSHLNGTEATKVDTKMPDAPATGESGQAVALTG
jgi:broad specificity phosphatase PhoE